MRTCVDIIALLLFAAFSSCWDSGALTDSSSTQPHALGKMTLQLAGAPQGIISVVARLNRQGYPERTQTLTIVNSTASGGFSDIPIGTWHLNVDAFDSASVIRYAGETDVNVVGGDTTLVALQLVPTTGNIHIVVVWGGTLSNAVLVNGSFESGPPVATYVSLDPGSTALTGWIVTRGQIDISSYWQSFDGSRSLDLDGTPGRGGVKQTIQTAAGALYLVRFAMAGNPEGPPATRTLGVSAANQSTQFTFDVAGRTIYSMGWQTKTWTFIAADSVTTIEFYSLDPAPGYYGPALDSVSVQRVR